ncbi:hypothetical protein KSC_026480 [Ktedonobacter sp. SOSP1-52]|uniref:DUF2690 domain-containing protein n=1 Tax=Ktedonobacter sp. SOSP1-52 TaxID=2778366 RepID=UPI0019157B87|nr:DUF2690 domain-containing protein [Ktedonobacter sp. SOSP1-52]GHO63756.1 hypothetical protein KSC_026480 [Ktedonobacter sp. SOSP1-52]
MLSLRTAKTLLSLRRLALFGIMTLVLCATWVYFSGTVSAHTNIISRAQVGCYGYSCDGKNPIVMGCDADAWYEYTDTGSAGLSTAAISLRFSPACGAAWALVKFDSPLEGEVGNAIITRNNDGRQYDCANGGNGIVLRGQTSCYSGMVGDADYTLSAYASGMYNYGSGWIRACSTPSY